MEPTFVSAAAASAWPAAAGRAVAPPLQRCSAPSGLVGRRAPLASPLCLRGRRVSVRRGAAGGGEGGEPESKETPFWERDIGGMLFASLSGFLGFLSGLAGGVFAFVGNLSESLASPVDRPESIWSVKGSLGAPPLDSQSDSPVYSLGPFPVCTDASNLRLPGRRYTILTTAALPWRVGPAVNALVRALHLAKSGCQVVLRLPWVEPEAQEKLFGGSGRFEDKASQEQYIRQWCVERVGINSEDVPLEIRWYDATYVEAVRSIFPLSDVSEDLSEDENDVLILEEPEHLNWFHQGRRWPDLFRHVIGVVHTNYRVYLAGMGYDGLLGNPAVRDSLLLTFTSIVCNAYCDVNIRLSSAGGQLPNDVIQNVHGVREEFLRIGAQELPAEADDSQPRAYFVGKAVFPKGWTELLSLLGKGGCADVPLHAFGSGADFEAIVERAAELRDAGATKLEVFPEVDHIDARLRTCSTLVNPSTSEILCTVTAEALAMRKRVVLPRHPSNRFFVDNFADRIHVFEPGDAPSFAQAVRAALEEGWAPPLTAPQRELLSWEAAIERLFDAVEVHVLSGQYSRPSQVQSARLAYEAHAGIQRDTPSLSKLLKDATLKSRSPWEETLAQWRDTEIGKTLMTGQVSWPPPGWESALGYPVLKDEQVERKELLPLAKEVETTDRER